MIYLEFIQRHSAHREVNPVSLPLLVEAVESQTPGSIPYGDGGRGELEKQAL